VHAPFPAATAGTRLIPPDAVVSFWHALQHAQLNDGDKLLQLPNGEFHAVCEGLSFSWLVARKCYPAIVEQIFGHHNCSASNLSFQVTVSGTPGVGKSTFALYLLWRIIQFSDWPVYYRVSEATSYMFQRGNDRVIQLTILGLVDEFSRVGACSWYILDCPLSDSVSFPGKKIWVSSPKGSEGFKQFDKTASMAGLSLVVPSWPWDEVEYLAKTRGSDVQATWNAFGKHGGVARLLMSSNPEKEMLALTGAITSRDALSNLKVDGTAKEMRELNHRLVHMIPCNPPLDYTYGGVVLASDFVADQLVAVNITHNLKLLSSLLGEETAIGGHLFERYAHYYMTNVQEKAVSVRCLSDGELEVDQGVLNGTEDRVTVDGDIPALSVGNYYVPASSTFPAVDAWSLRGMFQMTVASSHPVEFSGKAVDVLRLRSMPMRLFFVVPERKAVAFGVQNLVAPRGVEIQQWVVGIPVDIGVVSFDSSLQ